MLTARRQTLKTLGVALAAAGTVAAAPDQPGIPAEAHRTLDALTQTTVHAAPSARLQVRADDPRSARPVGCRSSGRRAALRRRSKAELGQHRPARAMAERDAQLDEYPDLGRSGTPISSAYRSPTDPRNSHFTTMRCGKNTAWRNSPAATLTRNSFVAAPSGGRARSARFPKIPRRVFAARQQYSVPATPGRGVHGVPQCGLGGRAAPDRCGYQPGQISTRSDVRGAQQPPDRRRRAHARCRRHRGRTCRGRLRLLAMSRRRLAFVGPDVGGDLLRRGRATA